MFLWYGKSEFFLRENVNLAKNRRENLIRNFWCDREFWWFHDYFPWYLFHTLTEIRQHVGATVKLGRILFGKFVRILLKKRLSMDKVHRRRSMVDESRIKRHKHSAGVIICLAYCSCSGLNPSCNAKIRWFQIAISCYHVSTSQWCDSQ